jgi:hypothetical protein
MNVSIVIKNMKINHNVSKHEKSRKKINITPNKEF